jgi:hypothetical protein
MTDYKALYEAECKHDRDERDKVAALEAWKNLESFNEWSNADRKQTLDQFFSTPPAPPEPSGLWACWAEGWDDAAAISVVHGYIPTPISWERTPIPASMTAGEIARLTAGDCRRMKGE